MSEHRRVHPNGDTYCAECKKERTKKARKKSPEKYSEYSWKSRIKKMYGINEQQYAELFLEQEGKCSICKSILEFRSRQTHIDHDHDTLEVRGLLCHSCNTALGLFKEDEEIMLSAIQYINKFK